jgi:hypothetical protein
MCVVSLSAAAIAFSACGSSPDKKVVPRYTEGGEGGNGGEATNNGATAGSAGNGTTAGTGGASGGTTGDAGAAGETNVTPQGGAAGSSPEPTGGAGAGGDGSVAPFHGLYVGTTGSDTTGDGSVGSPFASLTKAVATAKAGDTIVFLAGTYTVLGKQIATTVIPDGVNLMAEAPGAVTLSGDGNATFFKLAGSSQIEGFKFNSFQSVVEFVDGPTATGTLTIKDSSFKSCSYRCLNLSGTTTTNIQLADDAVLGDSGPNFALVDNQASLQVTGGIFQFYQGGNVINATADASVTLDHTTFVDCTSLSLMLDMRAAAHLSHVNMAVLASGLITQKGQSSLTIADSDLSVSPPSATGQCIRLEMDGVGSIEITDSKLHDCNGGFSGALPKSLTLTRVEIYSMKFGGLDLTGGAGSVGASVFITDSNFHDFAGPSLRINNGANDTKLKVRGTKFLNNTGANSDTVVLQTSLGSDLDFGTLAEPGGNTFANNNVNNTALRLGVNGWAMTANAVGNTWIAGVQGADAQGHYAATGGAGAKLDIDNTSPNAVGRNYSVAYAGSHIRLAQNP